PPSSRYPTIASGDLVPAHDMAPRPAWKLDFSVEPPKILGSYPTLVPRVDVDGNETSGVRLPAIQVPLGAYTGWNLRDPSIGAPTQMYSMIGSFLAFPRKSIVERYPSRGAYLDKVAAAAEQLASDRFLL